MSARRALDGVHAVLEAEDRKLMADHRRARVRRLAAKRPPILRVTVDRTDAIDPDGWNRLVRILRSIVDKADIRKDPQRR